MPTNGGMQVPDEYLRLAREYDREERLKLKQEHVKQESPEIKLESPPKTSVPADSIMPMPVQQQELDFDDSESDFEYEDVDFDEVDGEEGDSDHIEAGPVEFALEAPKTRRVVKYRRSVRLQIHFAVLACLLAHAKVRNLWLNSHRSQTALRQILPTVIVSELVPPSHITGFLRTKRLLEGLRHAAAIWRKKFAITDIGLYTVPWHAINDPERLVPPKLTRSDFLAQLAAQRGSIDLFGQGFCALLRAHGLRCRLVTSLQPPDWTSPGRNLGAEAFPGLGRINTIPTYWTEVWAPEESRWIVVDPLTMTVELSRATAVQSLEPAVSDQFNIMRYCIAFNSDGSARDVTRRYASRYNTRTRKKRIQYAGSEWDAFYNELLGLFAQKSYSSDDIAEIRQLTIREESEGFPNSAQGFVRHPLYALQSQLRQHEFIRPGAKQMGTTLIKGKVVPVFQRKDVHECKSAAQWWRMGYVPRDGVQARTTRSATDRQTKEKVDVDLYAESDVRLYKPPEVEDGIVPKSEYHSIDLFAPNMLPKGATHLRGKLATRATKILRVDHANAVVSVSFNGGAPSSQYDGVVVANEFVEAINAVMVGLHAEDLELELEEENLRLLLLWRKFIIANRIRARIDSMNPDLNNADVTAAEALQSATVDPPSIETTLPSSNTKTLIPPMQPKPSVSKSSGDPTVKKQKTGHVVALSQDTDFSFRAPSSVSVSLQDEHQKQSPIFQTEPIINEYLEVESDESYPDCFLDESDDFDE